MPRSLSDPGTDEPALKAGPIAAATAISPTRVAAQRASVARRWSKHQPAMAANTPLGGACWAVCAGGV